MSYTVLANNGFFIRQLRLRRDVSAALNLSAPLKLTSRYLQMNPKFRKAVTLPKNSYTSFHFESRALLPSSTIVEFFIINTGAKWCYFLVANGSTAAHLICTSMVNFEDSFLLDLQCFLEVDLDLYAIQ